MINIPPGTNNPGSLRPFIKKLSSNNIPGIKIESGQLCPQLIVTILKFVNNPTNPIRIITEPISKIPLLFITLSPSYNKIFQLYHGMLVITIRFHGMSFMSLLFSAKFLIYFLPFGYI